MSRLATFPYRVRKRLMREIRKRMGGLDLAWDRLIFRRRNKGRERDLLLALSDWAPWRDNDDLGFIDSARRDEIVSKAEEACRHEFDLLGSGLVCLGEEIDWHCDFKSGFRWDRTMFYDKVRKIPVPPGVDIKVPWELSRCMHFSVLGLADRITGNEKYYQEFKRQVRHWIAENPVARGVNWCCPMDVALRAVNWINAAMLFRHRLASDPDGGFFGDMAEALWMAGEHIFRNLEWEGPKSHVAGNHFLSDLVGLLGLGLMFRHTRVGRRWLRFSRKWLEREMQRQVNPDGTNFETSTSYHRLAMEMLLWANAVCEKADMPFSESYRGRLGRMADFVTAYTAPSGKAAQFGDNDSGRVLTAGVGDPSDHRYLIAGACTPGGVIDRWLLCGGDAPPGTPGDGAFPDGGYWFGSVGEMWIGVRAGPIDHGGAHAHCDQLSIVVNFCGVDVFVDPGTGVYTADPEIRNLFRSTRSHNTPQVNEWEQNLFGSTRSQIFLMGKDARSKVLVWEKSVEKIEFSGLHNGYGRHRSNLTVKRTLRVAGNLLTIIDEFTELVEGDRIEWCFHLAPGIRASRVPGGILVDHDEQGFLWAFPKDVDIRIVETEFSPEYGVLRKNLGIRMVATVVGSSCTSGFEFRLSRTD